MKQIPLFIIPLLLLDIASFATDKQNFSSAAGKIDPNLKIQAQNWMIPNIIRFTENKGQMSDMEGKPVNDLLFKAETNGVDMYVTKWGLSYVFINAEKERKESMVSGTAKERFPGKHKDENIKIEYCRADMELVGANIKKENIIKENENDDHFNYYLNHCPDGILNVHSYKKITIINVYPGIDWVIYNSPSISGVKYDFIVHPGSNPSQIKLKYKWTDPPHQETDGSLSISTPMGRITEGEPHSYLEGTNQYVNTIYIINQNEIRFSVDNYNSQEILIIDPDLLWATYFGGNSLDGPQSISADGSNVWITGYVVSTNFPTFDPGGGAYFQGTNTNGGGFIAKFNTAGVRQWVTYYEDIMPYSISSDGTDAWVTGSITTTTFSTQNMGGAYFDGTIDGVSDAFILKFNTAGIRQWATYYGGSGIDQAYSISSDGTNVWVTGSTRNGGFPTQDPGGGAYFQSIYGGGGDDAFILKFTTAGVLIWATYYGGSGGEMGFSISSDGTNVWVTGSTGSTDLPKQDPGGGAYFQSVYGGGGFGGDAFILKFNTTGVRQWATYYGGSGIDQAYSINSDGTNVWITGSTGSTDFFTQDPGGGAYFQNIYGGGSLWGSDAFILKFNTTGVRQWATYYGGSGNEVGASINSDGTNVWVTGSTNSTDFPTQDPGDCSPFYGTHAGFRDVLILQFNTSGVRQYATYYGWVEEDWSNDATIDPVTGCAYLTGEWILVNGVPTVNPGGGAYYQPTMAGQHDGFIMKFCPCFSILNVTATSTNSLCNGQCTGTGTANPSSGNPPYTYNWSNSQTTQTISGLCAGTYTVIVTDAAGDSVAATVIVTQPAILTATATSTATICGSNNGTSTINASGGTQGYAYSWSNGQTTQTATGLVAGNYTSTVTDANGCTTTQTVTIVSSGGSINTSQSPILCSGSTYTLPGGTVVSTSGAYIDTLISAAGCDSIITTTLTVNPNPTATAFSNVTITQGQTATLTASGGSIYNWSNGANGSSITVTPPVTTLYCVTVTDANNCTDTACVTVTIEQIDCSLAGELYLPNAFSPSGDGENDKLQIYFGNLKCIKIFNLVIYNRWGEQVFATNTTAFTWDGSYKSKTMNTSVIVYYMKATMVDGREIIKKGNISLLR